MHRISDFLSAHKLFYFKSGTRIDHANFSQLIVSFHFLLSLFSFLFYLSSFSPESTFPYLLSHPSARRPLTFEKALKNHLKNCQMIFCNILPI
jgi:hypothetical protein